MHRLKLGAATLVLLALPWLAAAQTDISGPWIVTVDSPQGPMELDTTFTQEGEKVTGQVSSPMGAVQFSGTMVNDALSILYTVPVQGQLLEIRLTGQATGETMSGAVDLGGLMQAQWTARRKPPVPPGASVAAASPAPPTSAGVSGKWHITVRLGPNVLPLTGQLQQQAEAVTGTIGTPFGQLPVSGTMAGTTLTMEFTAPLPQGPLTVTMNGQLGPSGLSGTSSIAGLGESEWSATRVVE